MQATEKEADELQNRSASFVHTHKKKDERTKVLPEHRERGMTKILIRKNKIFLFGKKAAAKGRKSNLCDQLPIHREREGEEEANYEHVDRIL